MWKLTQDCENDMCNREPHNRQTKLCIHHHTVYNLFLEGMTMINEMLKQKVSDGE